MELMSTISRARLLAIVLCFPAVLAVSATGVQAASETIATFADPSGNSSTPLFTFTGAGPGADPTGLKGSTLEGSWNVPGLTLIVQGVSTANVTFEMDKLFATGVTAGGFEFNSDGSPHTGANSLSEILFKSGNTELLKILFRRAHLGGGGEFASDLLLDDVTIDVIGTGQVFTEEFFSFAFVGQTGSNPFSGTIGSGDVTTWTASFASSGTLVDPGGGPPPVVPVPAAVWTGMSLLGAIAIVREVRHKFAIYA